MSKILQNSDKDQILKDMLQNMMEIVMEKERTEFLGYPPQGERFPPGMRRGNHRNGYRSRELTTGLGLLDDLKVPRDRLGEFYPMLIDAFERRTTKVDDLVLSLYRKGMSDRDISEVLSEIYGKQLSAATISNVAKEVEVERLAWEKRPLKPTYTAIFIDCLHLKVRRNVVDTDAVYIAYGIDQDGHRDALGMWIGAAESATEWEFHLSDLKDRGVKQVLLFVMDGLTGLESAVNTVFPRSKTQRCVVHQVRYTLSNVRPIHKAELADDLKTIYRSETREQAEAKLTAVASKWRKLYPRLMASWENHANSLFTFYSFPVFLRRYIYTTNWLERLNKELRKVTKTKNSFPTETAVLNLVFCKLTDTAAKWENRCLAGFDSHRLELNELWQSTYPSHEPITH
jgi:putative transposase